MKRIVWMNLQMFADGEGAVAAEAAPAAPASGGAEIQAAGTESMIRAGDTLADGRQVQGAQVAAELNRQMRKHPELRKVYGQRPQETTPQKQPEKAEAQPAEKTIQERWDELIKGEFKELYGQGVQNAIKDRFKNQQDATKQLEAQNEVLAMAMKDRGVQSLDELKKSYQETDPQIEEEAERAGMTRESYLTLKALQDEIHRRDERDRQTLEEQANINHYRSLVQQAEELKKIVPDFDLQKELNTDPEFFRLTTKEVGLSVKDAFYVRHGEEIAAASMKAGIERAQKQMGQTIRAQGMRPVEGAAHGQGQPAVKAQFDFNAMTPQERKKFRSQVLAGKVVIPGG